MEIKSRKKEGTGKDKERENQAVLQHVEI